MRQIFKFLIAAVMLFPSLALAQSQRNPCFYNTNGGCTPVSTANPLPVDASVTASISGFNQESVLTPFSATTSGVSSGSFTAGKVIIVTNVGATNIAYCQLGTSATTSGQPIAPNGGWFAFTSITETKITCATSTSTTTINVSVGTGIPTGTGGGGGGSGGGTIIQGNTGTNAQAWWMQLGDTTNGPVAVKPASTAAAQTDPALVQRNPDIGTIGDSACGSATGSCTTIQLNKFMAQQLVALVSGLITPPLAVNPNPYPQGSTPITASATGTTAATTATLAGTSGKTTYICGYSIRANATSATTVTDTITGVISGTLSSVLWVAPNAGGIGVDENTFTPCIPASGTNQAIAVVSGAPGTGGAVSSRAWGYQL